MSDVKVSVTFRHTEPTHALKKYVEQKIHRIGKYFSHPLDAHVILAVESKDCQVAEVELHTLGAMIHGREKNQDLYAAIDLAMDKIQRQITKRKEKIKLNRRRSAE
ncbi:MAG TPA: ribosome-associated translation inhibitor RaiA [Candidatus Binatia bacterium]|nr:ribosome-associated translation inhibitor RaiA [Candidatus Binatia bacterium]